MIDCSGPGDKILVDQLLQVQIQELSEGLQSRAPASKTQ